MNKSHDRELDRRGELREALIPIIKARVEKEGYDFVDVAKHPNRVKTSTQARFLDLRVCPICHQAILCNQWCIKYRVRRRTTANRIERGGVEHRAMHRDCGLKLLSYHRIQREGLVRPSDFRAVVGAV